MGEAAAGLGKGGGYDSGALPGRAPAVPGGSWWQAPTDFVFVNGLEIFPRGVKYSQMLTELVYSPDILHGEKSKGDSLSYGTRATLTTA